MQHRQHLMPRGASLRLDRRGMQILTSIDFLRPTFLTDSTAGFRDGRGRVRLKYYSHSGPDRIGPWIVAVEVLAAGRSGDFEIRLLKSHEAFAARARARNKKDEIPEPHTVSPRTIVRGNISLRSFALFLPLYCLSLSLSSSFSPSKDLHFYCHSARLKTRGHIVLPIISTCLFLSPLDTPMQTLARASQAGTSETPH